MAQPAPILTIPGEIRNQIYSYLFLLPTISTRRTLGDPPLHSSILSTCSQIHREGIQILYGSNTFLAHPSLLSGLPRLRLYYPAISSQALISLITRYHIRVRLDCDPNFSKEQAAEAFSCMDTVTIEVFQAQFGGSDFHVLELFEGIRGVGKARVYGSVTKFPEYVQWLEGTMMSKEGDERVFDLEEEKRAKDLAVRSDYDIWIHGGR